MMKIIYLSVILISITQIIQAEEVKKQEFMQYIKTNGGNQLCEIERFQKCTEDSESLCKAQMKMAVVPSCIKSKLSDLPETFSVEFSNQKAQEFAQCIALLYPKLNQLDLQEFGKCMSGK